MGRSLDLSQPLVWGVRTQVSPGARQSRPMNGISAAMSCSQLIALRARRPTQSRPRPLRLRSAAAGEDGASARSPDASRVPSTADAARVLSACSVCFPSLGALPEPRSPDQLSGRRTGGRVPRYTR